MDRREALKRTALALGGILSAPTIAGILNGCTAKPTLDWKPQFFSKDHGILISEIAEIIIPKTDTPGAKELGVPGFIDIMVKDVFSQEDRDRFMKGLRIFASQAEKEYGDPFIELNKEDKTAFVKKIHDMAITARVYKTFILKVKELTVAGYFTSEIGATKILQYAPVPGAYKGCLPLNQAGEGKTWAT